MQTIFKTEACLAVQLKSLCFSSCLKFKLSIQFNDTNDIEFILILCLQANLNWLLLSHMDKENRKNIYHSFAY